MSDTSPPVARFSICVLEDADSRLLFLLRAHDRPLGPDKWGFPAGHIGMYVSGKVQRDLPPAIADWLKARA